MQRWWLWLLVAVAIIGWVLARQVSYLSLVGTAGATIVLERGSARVPATLFAGVEVPEGGATLLESGEAFLGAYTIFELPDGSRLRCIMRLGRVACADGWQMRFTRGLVEAR